jgi:hypothetical protein
LVLFFFSNVHLYLIHGCLPQTICLQGVFRPGRFSLEVIRDVLNNNTRTPAALANLESGRLAGEMCYDDLREYLSVLVEEVEFVVEARVRELYAASVAAAGAASPVSTEAEKEEFLTLSYQRAFDEFTDLCSRRTELAAGYTRGSLPLSSQLRGGGPSFTVVPQIFPMKGCGFAVLELPGDSSNVSAPAAPLSENIDAFFASECASNLSPTLWAEFDGRLQLSLARGCLVDSESTAWIDDWLQRHSASYQLSVAQLSRSNMAPLQAIAEELNKEPCFYAHDQVGDDNEEDHSPTRNGFRSRGEAGDPHEDIPTSGLLCAYASSAATAAVHEQYRIARNRAFLLVSLIHSHENSAAAAWLSRLKRKVRCFLRCGSFA